MPATMEARLFPVVPVCPICRSRESEAIVHPCGRFLCDTCFTVFNGDEIEWKANEGRRAIRGQRTRNAYALKRNMSRMGAVLWTRRTLRLSRIVGVTAPT